MGARGNTRQELSEVVQLVARHQLRSLIAGHFPLEQVNAALTQLATGQEQEGSSVGLCIYALNLLHEYD